MNSKINIELSKINTWFKANKLSLNIEKTNYMHFRSNGKKYKHSLDLKLNIDEIEIRRVTQIKFLAFTYQRRFKLEDPYKGHFAKNK